MNISRRIKKALRGRVKFRDLFFELARRQKIRQRRKFERQNIDIINRSPARLSPEFTQLNTKALATHFRHRKSPYFFCQSFEELKNTGKSLSKFYAAETEQIVARARRIAREDVWDLAGFGELSFASENGWRRDPLTGAEWNLDYHGDLQLTRADGTDVRVLWELNRFGHALVLAQGYAVTGDEIFAKKFFTQIENWREQNPYGLGANWSCAMEVALRAINLLAAFDIFRYSSAMTDDRLSAFLQLFDQHGRFIFDNLEFSYVSTSNHYFSDVAGLVWLGTFLPELECAEEWKRFGLRELFSEMDKQILADGADFESSTGYHKFITEIVLFSFLLCEKNGLEIPEKYWRKLRSMLEFIRGYLRPDGLAPLTGDADGSQILPLVKRNADDQSYLLALAAITFDGPEFKISDAPATPEILWLFGEKGMEKYQSMTPAPSQKSQAFPDAGAYVMRDRDLYLHFNASDCGLNGRGSHAHNDALSIEISAFGRAFIVDPGSYLYGADLAARHLFRSTAYHSTVQIDEAEQNTTEIEMPFVIGNEARPKVLNWETAQDKDFVAAEHYGYRRLKNPLTHRRSIEFYKREKFWLITDEFLGVGEHQFRFRFHLAATLQAKHTDKQTIKISDAENRRLLIVAPGLRNSVLLEEEAWVSNNYGAREKSLSVGWSLTANVPLSVSLLLVALTPEADEQGRLKEIQRQINNR